MIVDSVTKTLLEGDWWTIIEEVRNEPSVADVPTSQM